MPVTKSAKRALRVAHRRHAENLATKGAYKKALKATRQAVEAGAANVGELLQKAQSALDTAAKSKTMHRNKAARLKSRLAKRIAASGLTITVTPKAKRVAPKAASKKAAKPAAKPAAAKKPVAKKAAAKK